MRAHLNCLGELIKTYQIPMTHPKVGGAQESECLTSFLREMTPKIKECTCPDEYWVIKIKT